MANVYQACRDLSPIKLKWPDSAVLFELLQEPDPVPAPLDNPIDRLQALTAQDSPIWIEPPYLHEVALYRAGLAISLKVLFEQVGQQDVRSFITLLNWVRGLRPGQVMTGVYNNRKTAPVLLTEQMRFTADEQIKHITDPNFVRL